jgi:hypothetical protein
MTERLLLRVAILALVGYLGSAGPALADAVTHWNNIAQAAIPTGRPGPIGAIDSALIQAAVYDAVQAIERDFKPYHKRIRGADGSADAAAAAAAHGVLVGLYPSKAEPTGPTDLCPLGTCLNKALEDYLAANNLVGDPGIAVGEEVAAAFLLLYRAAPDPAPVFNGCDDEMDGCQAGEWRPTPPALATMFAPWAAGLEPYTLISGSQFRAPAPPGLTSVRYRRDYNEVKALGSLTNEPCVNCGRFEGFRRTDAQTVQAYFFSENFLAQYNRTLRELSETKHLSISKNSRLYALANLAMSDAFITAWDSKVHFNYWRPITAVQEGDNDGNDHTVGDTGWVPLIATPPYPDYTSGANNLTGAFTRSLRLFFGRDKLKFSVTSNAVLTPGCTTDCGPLGPAGDPRRTRNYERISRLAQDVVEARIFLGIHFRTADVEARKQGESVAGWVFRHFLRPKHNKHRHGHHWDGDDCDRD